MNENDINDERLKKMKSLDEHNSCPIDLEPYDLDDRKPIILNKCGHSMCKSCFNKLTDKTCPFCRMPVTSILNNYDKSSTWSTLKR